MFYPDEYLDLVNDNDEVIGKKLRLEIYQENLHNFRVVNAFVKNSLGELWIPRRTADKRLYPLCLDMSVGGHVESGETYEETFKRETLEELNVNIDKIAWHKLGKLSPKEGLSAFMQVYEIMLDDAPEYNQNDFTEFFWLTPKALIKKILDGDQAKSDLIKLVQKFYKI